MKNYSTYDNKNFFIQKNSTLPVLKLQLLQSIMEQYDITSDMLENAAITFSMKNIENGIYQIANVPANLIINNNRPESPDEVEYTLTYKFRIKDTKKPGRFVGEFKIDFLGDSCGKITLPNNEPINIIIGGSITKTSIF